nr:protein Daple-like [Ipomoea batatas]
MIISPPNAGFGSFGITRSPSIPMQAMPTIMDTLSGLPQRTTRPLSLSSTPLPFSTQGRSLDPTVPRGVRSKLTQPELNSLDEWLGEGVQMMVPPDNQNMVEPPNSRVMVITINSPDSARVDRPSGPPPGGPSIEYDPHDPLLARGHEETSRPRPLRPYHPDHIDFIHRGVREMVPATTRFWMDSSPMDALSSHLVGDLMNEASQDYAASEEALRELGDRHQQLKVTHEAMLKELDAFKTAHTALQLAHSTLQGEHEKQQVAHTHALEHAIEDWQGTEDLAQLTNMLARAMVDAMSKWYDAQDYQAYLGPPLVQVLQEGAVTAGGQREMQDQFYGKLRRHFTFFSIAGWKLPKYLPLRRPPAPVMPTSTTTPADGFLMSPERAGGASSVALPSDPVGGSGVVGSVDPSLSLHFTSGSGFSGPAAGFAAP